MGRRVVANIFGLILIILSVSVYADDAGPFTLPATPAYQDCRGESAYGVVGENPLMSESQVLAWACGAGWQSQTTVMEACHFVLSAQTPTSKEGWIRADERNLATNEVSPNQAPAYMRCYTPVQTCPLGYSLWNGNQCVRQPCPAPQNFEPSTGQCVAPPCTPGAGEYTGSLGAVSGSTPPSGSCMGGCVYSTSGLWACAAGKCFGSLGEKTGESCSGGDDRPATDAESQCKLSGGCPSYVSGVVVCGRCDSTSDKTTTNPPAPNKDSMASSTKNETLPDGSVKTTEKQYSYNPDGSVTVNKKETTTHPDGSQTVATSTIVIPSSSVTPGSSTTGVSSHVNPDGTVTTTTKNDYIYPDGSTGSSSSSSTSSMAGFCKENPDSPICKKSSIGDAQYTDCSAAPTCDGDAIQCATAKYSWQSVCEQRKLTAEIVGNNPYKVLASEGNASGDQSAIDAAVNRNGIGDIDLSSKWQENRQNYIQWASSCVSEAGFDFKGQHYTFNFGFICEIAQFVRVMVHLAAYMVAVRILERGI